MRFGDSETEKLLRSTARSYLAERFPWERLYALERGDAPLTGDEMKGFAERGLFGLLAPESKGGGGLSLLEAAAVIEEIGYAAVPATVTVSNVAACILGHASPDVAGEHLAALASGRRLYTVSEAVRRRGRQNDARAAASGGGIRGVLPLVPFASVADFVLAPLAVEGEAAFAVLPLERARLEPVRLLDRSGYADAHFEGVALERAALLATGRAAEDLQERCDALMTALSLVELAGMMQRVTEMTAEYITGRVQFGQPIAKFQAARHRAAELLTQAETTRWTAYHALWAFQQDPAHTEEIWLAKHWAVRAAERVFQVSHLLHGGVGVGTEYPLHLYTQGIAGLAARAGTMDEMVERTLESLRIGAGAG
ncbi:MAG: acyl-CoA/acyl-ACP dehydrogenase [Chloroflexi bacterium]|nr:acyl-CoA/acyl-ACP dehydrogenase [Chloroflexota bacterium]